MYSMPWNVNPVFYHYLMKREAIMTEIEKETGMTEKECEYWDEYVKEKPVTLGPDLAQYGIKPGYARHYLPLDELDTEVVDYLQNQSSLYQKSKIKIINEIIREKLSQAEI